MDKIPGIIDLDELRDSGYLLEANRRFFHPLGLALFIMYSTDTGEPLGLDVFDWRHDPEGCVFDQFTRLECIRAAKVEQEWQKRGAVRRERLGFVIQPLDE